MGKVDGLVDEWKSDARMAECISHVPVVGRPARFGAFPEWADSRILRTLAASGITNPYVHQEAAMEAVRSGRHTVLVTPTASGKTLAYNVPVIQSILEDSNTRALYIFPTKALAQDQYAAIMSLLEGVERTIAVHTFDGDTPSDARQAVRESGNIILTNPDMLHSGILPLHPQWVKVFTNLKYIIIDEMHTYRGVFGSHFSNVIRRLKRIAAHYGSRPCFVMCSATIANPAELASKLVEEDVSLVDDSGAPTSLRHVVFYNPPIINQALGIRSSYIRQTSQLAVKLFTKRISTIVFALSRLNVELLLKYIRESVVSEGLSPDLVQGYRGGYLPNRRREIERGLRDGTTRCVVATNALELGIDIGSLDAVVVAGYPGSVASLVQQWGRAGRRGESSLAVLVGRSHPVDQYLLEHPGFLMSSSAEEGRIDPDNPFILADHLKCAVFELPLSISQGFGRLSSESVEGMLEILAAANTIRRFGDRFMWTAETFPASAVSLRNIPGENFVVIDQDTSSVKAEVDFVGAHTTLHEGAIHSIDGVQYQVKRLDYVGRKAFISQDNTDYYTDAESHIEVKPLATHDSWSLGRSTVASGDVLVAEKVVGFKKIRFHTGENVGYGQVSLPELQMHTMAGWLSLGDSMVKALPFDRVELAHALGGIARVVHRLAAFRLMCSESDVGYAVGEGDASWYISQNAANTAAVSSAGGYSLPILYYFDRRPGGLGLGPRIAQLMPSLLADARDVIGGCVCDSGCPRCCGPVRIGHPRTRVASIALIDGLLAHE